MELKYRLAATTPLTVELISKYLEKDKANNVRKKKLFDYYVGKQNILKRQKDVGKPNHKVVNPYANYITDIMTGYFVGEPITYKSTDDEMFEIISAIFNYNDEAAENAELAKDASVCGCAYELMYLDSDKQIRFKSISPIGAIPIYENTVEEDLLYFIRYYDEEDILTGRITTIVEIYTRNEVITYKKDYTAGGLSLVSNIPHSWKMVPVVDYYNNEEAIGDFEPVITEIDAYDTLESDSLNDMDYFADAYLGLYGMSGTTAEDVAALKEDRLLLLPTGGKAEWITKSPNDTYIENMKTRLDANIHKFSKCPAMTDTAFAANASGVAMKYKLMGLENATSKKERAFKKGLQRRLELICNMLAVMGTVYDYRAINIVFTRNIPANLLEMAQVVNQLGTLVSEETKMSLLPIEIDYQEEQLKKQKENEASYSINFDNEGDMNNGRLLEEENISQ